MQGTQQYTGSEQRIDVCICENDTREVVGFVSGSLPTLRITPRRPQGEAAGSNDVVERALLSAYRHLVRSKGSVPMSTWLTAIAVLVVGPDCAEEPVPNF
jgi:DNA-directed RNA polymerase specialized sigma24 family protein